jgi:hypothetical protein
LCEANIKEGFQPIHAPVMALHPLGGHLTSQRDHHEKDVGLQLVVPGLEVLDVLEESKWMTDCPKVGIMLAEEKLHSRYCRVPISKAQLPCGTLNVGRVSRREALEHQVKIGELSSALF